MRERSEAPPAGVGASMWMLLVRLSILPISSPRVVLAPRAVAGPDPGDRSPLFRFRLTAGPLDELGRPGSGCHLVFGQPKVAAVADAAFLGPAARDADLFFGNRDGGGPKPRHFGQIKRHGTPAAADVERFRAGFRQQFAGDQPLLGALGILQALVIQFIPKWIRALKSC